MDESSRPRGAISRAHFVALNRRSDGRGAAQLAAHAAALAATAVVVQVARGSGWLVPALVVHALVLVFMFAALHECIHATAFRSRWLNAAVAVLCGTLLCLPPRYFRLFHFAHHRYTQDKQRDPELATPKPETWGGYLYIASGLGYWRERVMTTLSHALGGRADEPFIPPAAGPGVVAEARLLWAVYALIAAAAALAGAWTMLVVYWLAPVLLGQPALRLFLLAEHTGCPHVADMLHNSRTTLTGAALRRLAWNMPYHAEHHAFPSVPFHALPALHRAIGASVAIVAPGYAGVHRRLLATLAR